MIFGFADDLIAASIIAVGDMLATIMQQLRMARKEALALASVAVYLA